MKPVYFHRSRKRQMVQDAFIVLTPPILMFVGILWFCREEWLPSRLERELVSFIDSLIAFLTSAV